MLSIVIDSPRKIKNLQEEYKSPIQFIVDRKKKISKDYKVFLGKDHPQFKKFQVEHAIPSKFLINKNAKIVWQELSETKERPSMNTLLKVLEEMLD